MQNHQKVSLGSEMWKSEENIRETYFFEFFGSKTVLFELLHAKPCRTIMKLPQKVSLGPDMCEIEPQL